MKEVLLILVGGTICTAVNEKGTLTVNEAAGIQLKANYENSDSPYAGEVRITLSDNLFILSENMTVKNWNLILDTYREYMSKGNYDGVIFAHGTDTLAYSAALFSLILSNTEIPVFFVSSNARLGSPRANGDANFRCAVECICRGISPNVYAAYKNLSDGQMYLHLASRLKQCENYSEDFYSEGAINITDMSQQNYAAYFEKIEKMYPADKRKALIDVSGNWHLSNCVLFINPYVGLDYDAFDYSRFSAVLHGTYHSGTACAEQTEDEREYGNNSILHMIDLCSASKADVDVYFSPSKLEGEVYDTVRIIGEHKSNEKQAKFLYGYTNETAYAKLLLAYSLFKDKEEIGEFINTQCNFEKIY